MNILSAIHRLPEHDCERICKNIAFAFQDPNLAYYETVDWIEVAHGYVCIALNKNNLDNPHRFSQLLHRTVYKLKKIGKKIGAKQMPNSIEQVLINLDLHVNEQIAS